MRLRFLPLVAALLTTPLAAQNYNSSMNSAERARESMRYEAALLDGTYNNPMLQKSTVDMGIAYRGLGQAERDAEAAKKLAEYTRQEQQRQLALEQSREIALAAYRRAQQLEALERQLEAERQIARNGMARWRVFDLAKDPDLIAKAEKVRLGQLDVVPPWEVYPTALALRSLPPVAGVSDPARETERHVARLAVKAFADGQILPALLLSDPSLQDPAFLSFMALEGVNSDPVKAVYATGGHGWPTDNELFLARVYKMVPEDRLTTIAALRNKFRPTSGLPDIPEEQRRVLDIVSYSGLYPWSTEGAKLKGICQDDLVRLTAARPILGHFASALYEERLRYDPAAPSPWADFIFERAAQLAGPGFIREFVQLRNEASRPRESAALQDWLAHSGRDREGKARPVDTHALWRVAGRLILGHDLQSLPAPLSDLRDPSAAARRLVLAHQILWELSTRREPHALLIQYLAAIQDPQGDAPSRLAYLNAYHWTLGWDQPPVQFEQTPLLAASFLGACPASLRGRHFADSPGGRAMKLVTPPELEKTPYAIGSDGAWYSTGYLENLPQQFIIAPAVILARQRAAAEDSRLRMLAQWVRPKGFADRLALSLQADFARALNDAQLENQAREKLSALGVNPPPPASSLPASALDDALQLFAQTALRQTGTSLLRQPLQLDAAPDSEALLEAVALRNLAVKPFLPSIRLLPLPFAARVRLSAQDSPLRRMVAAQALASLDDSASVRVNLPVAALQEWVQTGAQGGDTLCQLRSAQLRLIDSPLAVSSNLDASRAEAILNEATAAGVPGAVEFAFSHARQRGQAITPEKLVSQVETALAQGSPIAALAWLDALGETRTWTPASALHETRALRVAREDFRNNASERWRNALVRWSQAMSAQRRLLVGQKEADAVASEVAAIVQMCDLVGQVSPETLTTYQRKDLLSILAVASASLPPSTEVSRLQQAFLDTFAVREELRFGDYIPLEAALTGTLSDNPTTREFAALDAVRWLAIKPRQMNPSPAYKVLNLLPDAPDQHPLWERSLGLRFIAEALCSSELKQAEPDVLTSNLRKIAGVLDRCRAQLSEAERVNLINAYAGFNYSTQTRSDLGTITGIDALVEAFDHLAREQPQHAASIYYHSVSLKKHDYTVALFQRLLQPGSTWVSLRSNAIQALSPSEHTANFQRVLSWDTAKLQPGLQDLVAWGEDAVAKLKETDAPALRAELAKALREVATKLAQCPANEPFSWDASALQLAYAAEIAAPSTEATSVTLSLLKPRAQSFSGIAEVYKTMIAWKDKAVAARDRELLAALQPFSPKLIDEAIDELDGFPRREAARKEYERKRDLIEPCLKWLEERRHVSLALRLIVRLMDEDFHIWEWTMLKAVEGACLDASGKAAMPQDSTTIALAARLLATGSASWENSDEDKALVLTLSPVARSLWETRSTWRARQEDRMMWLLRNYRAMGESWAIEAWKRLPEEMSPGLRLALFRSGLGENFGLPPLSEAELATPVYREAAEILDHPPTVEGDPVGECIALLASEGKQP